MVWSARIELSLRVLKPTNASPIAGLRLMVHEMFVRWLTANKSRLFSMVPDWIFRRSLSSMKELMRFRSQR